MDPFHCLSVSHSEPNIATTFWRRSRRKAIAEQRTASSRFFFFFNVHAISWGPYLVLECSLGHNGFHNYAQCISCFGHK